MEKLRRFLDDNLEGAIGVGICLIILLFLSVIIYVSNYWNCEITNLTTGKVYVVKHAIINYSSVSFTENGVKYTLSNYSIKEVDNGKK